MLSLMRVEDFMNALVEAAHVPYPMRLLLQRFCACFVFARDEPYMEAQIARGVELHHQEAPAHHAWLFFAGKFVKADALSTCSRSSEVFI